MVNLLSDSSQFAETLHAIVPWRDPSTLSLDTVELDTNQTDWEKVTGLEDNQRRQLQRLSSKGVLWKHPVDNVNFSPSRSKVFRLTHGGDVDSDGNCLFTASQKALGCEFDARELRRKTVKRFLQDLGSVSKMDEEGINEVIKHMYSPDLRSGWGIHVVQEVKLLARKEDRARLEAEIEELVLIGMQREMAAESVYKESCLRVEDGLSWAKYMAISGSLEDEHDVITLQYTEEGLLSVDDNREGRAAAFGDDIAIECLATEFKREIFVVSFLFFVVGVGGPRGIFLSWWLKVCYLQVQAHGSDAMVEEENCIFFLPHRPRGPVCETPIFLFMKGTGWCGAGGDHYEPLIARPCGLASHEKVALVV